MKHTHTQHLFNDSLNPIRPALLTGLLYHAWNTIVRQKRKLTAAVVITVYWSAQWLFYLLFTEKGKSAGDIFLLHAEFPEFYNKKVIRKIIHRFAG